MHTQDERFAALVAEGRHAETIERGLETVIAAAGGELSLLQEIGTLRLLLLRVIVRDGLDGEPYETARTVASLVEQITGLVRAQRLISGDRADDLAAALDAVLGELGVGN